MSVAVISKTGERLMPASEYRARKLLKSGKAIKHSYHPFTIQLTERETGDIQPIELCMDTGYIHIGISVKSEKHEYLAEQIDMLQTKEADMMHAVCIADSDEAEKDTVRLVSIIENETRDGLLHH